MSIPPANRPVQTPGRDGGLVFRHEARRDGKVIATLACVRHADGGFVVETTVTPVGRPPENAVTRAFPFAQAETARRFAEETLQALEFLGCEIAA